MSDSGDATTWTATVSADGPYTFFVVTWEDSGNDTIDSVTVGGNAASVEVQLPGNGAGVGIVKYTGAPPSAATLSVTFTGPVAEVPVYVSTLSVDDIESTTAIDTDGETGFTTLSDLDSLTGPGAGGIEIIGACARNDVVEPTLSNCTELVNVDAGVHRHMAAWVLGDPAGNPTITVGSNDQLCIVGASYT